MSMKRTAIPFPDDIRAALKRQAVKKHTSASEIVRRTIREADWFLFDKREQELLKIIKEEQSEVQR